MNALKKPKKDENVAQAGEGCCGGPAPEGVAACCVKDAEAKAIGEEGCGCGTAPVQASTPPSACCAPPPKDPPLSEERKPCWSPASDFKPRATRVSSDLTLSDRLKHLRCRLGAYRMSYSVAPGLYAVGEPTKTSDVFVSANYGMSFDHLRKALKGTDSWILVLDTKGINVWCAAGKGTFGTAELVERMNSVRLAETVSHRRIILPQLGAPGVAAHAVKEKTGFRVYYGPVRAEEIKQYVEAGYKATKEMRTVGFSFSDRLVLTPMEINPAIKIYLLYALAILIIFGLSPSGISFREAFTNGLPFLILGLAAIFSGALFTPLFLGHIPFRAFSVKGLLTGLVSTLIVSRPLGIASMSPLLQGAVFLFFPALSSYIAVQFTGSTVFTGLSGVKRELKYAIPAYMAAAALTLLLVGAYKLKEWGLA
ncbi:MAG: acetyl-CoA synthase subunit gamma [Deltaproteobacteria bacterium]|nr:acetyl-CoA synthase subunit gamma [Deltaproteobacteria bacterium]